MSHSNDYRTMNTHIGGRRAWPLGLVVLGASALQFGASAFAQGTTAGGVEEPTARSNQLEEVIVTSRRFSESLSDVPLSISAFNKNKLDVTGVKEFADVAPFTPGLTFNPNNNVIAIRGISSTAGASSTGVYIDGAPVHIRQFGAGAYGLLPVVFDLERIEVLRGPQGTLYGAGSQGGTVRFITPQPNLQSYEAYARSEVAFTQAGSPTYEAGFAVGGPIIEDKLGFRVSAFNRDEGGWIDWIDYNTGDTRVEDYNRSEVSSARAVLTWEPIEGLTITPSVFHQASTDHGSDTFSEFWSSFSNRDFNYANNLASTRDDRFTLSSVEINYEFGDYELVSNSSWFDRSGVNSGTGLWRIGNLQRNGGFPLLTRLGVDDSVGIPNYRSPDMFSNDQSNFTQEVRLQSYSPDARFTWVVGLYYGDSEQTNLEEGTSSRNIHTGEADYDLLYQKLYGQTILERFGFPLFEGKYSYVTDWTVWEKQKAAFVDATWNVTDKLSLSAGVRYSQVEFSFLAGRASMTQADWTYSDGETKEKPVTPRVNVTYRTDSDHMLYFNAGDGFRAGGANSAALLDRCAQNIKDLNLGDVSKYDSDEVRTYDVGAKGRVFNGMISYDVGAYVTDWTGIQQSNNMRACGGSYIGNFGEARAKGVDMVFQGMLTDNFLLELSLGYMNSEYTKNAFASSDVDAPLVIAKGNSLPGVVPFKAALGLTYSMVAFGNDSYIRADYQYESEEDGLLPTQDPRTTQFRPKPLVPNVPATSMVRLRAGMNFGERFNVAVFVNNLLDKSPLLSRNSQGGSDYYEVSTWRPRTVGMTVIYRY